jgi:CRP-like cAMP-binding protein
VLERGSAEVYVPKLGPDPVMTYSPGASFGELALMYNCPRAATVKVRSAQTQAEAQTVTTHARLLLALLPMPFHPALPPVL